MTKKNTLPSIFMHYILLILILLFASCTQKDHKQKLRGEYIYRHANEYFFVPLAPEPMKRPYYPWEERWVGGYPRITKEFFRCKGNRLNPLVIQMKVGQETVQLRDCQGELHGLPLRNGKEFIYPCLTELLNYIQEKTQKRIVITTGHRCPQHNSFCDQSSLNKTSKHQIGAEVDFYVEGMEQEPDRIISIIQDYYKTMPPFAGKNDYENFKRFEKEGLNVITPPWYNKEIFIKLFLESEGRDFDNQHGYPYICIQLKYDRDLDKPLLFDYKQVQNYLRH